MSISGSQEVKTAVFEANPAADTTESVAIDAQEDREILGVSWEASPNAGGAAPSAATLLMEGHIGTSALVSPAAGEQSVQDNRSWHYSAHAEKLVDDVNGNGAMTPLSDEMWYGHGSGIEWNEDSTLTFDITARNANGTGRVYVQYREL